MSFVIKNINNVNSANLQPSGSLSVANLAHGRTDMDIVALNEIITNNVTLSGSFFS